MAVTPKQNWRYPGNLWAQLDRKMRRLGVSRSVYLTAMCNLALIESDDQTRARLQLWNKTYEAVSAEAR